MLYLGEMKKEKVMKKIKFRKLENPMETVTVNGVEIVPDEVFEVTLPKNSNKVMVGGNWPIDFENEKDEHDFNEAMNGHWKEG